MRSDVYLLIGYTMALDFARQMCGRLMETADAMGWILLTYSFIHDACIFDTGGVVGLVSEAIYIHSYVQTSSGNLI